MSEELTLLPLPCPACGHPAGIVRANGTGCAFVMCQHVKCAFSGPIKITSEAAVAAWNALPRTLTWTDEPPKVPGWYWFKTAYRIHIVSVEHDHRKVDDLYICVGSVGIWMSNLHGQWAGPIPEPREPK